MLTVFCRGNELKSDKSEETREGAEFGGSGEPVPTPPSKATEAKHRRKLMEWPAAIGREREEGMEGGEEQGKTMVRR